MRRAILTLHRRILADIERRIVSGEWPPGHRIPFEVALAEQYGCSRMTVNKVLAEVARAGLIERRRRSGSFVRLPQAQSAVLEIRDIGDEVRSLGLPYSYRVTRRVRRRAGRGCGCRLDVPASTPVLDTECVHYAGPHPFCLEQRLINLDVVPEADKATFADIAPGPWLVSRVPWSAAEHVIRAAPADADLASVFGVAPGTACLVIERRTWSGTGPVTLVSFTYPGERHTLVARFQPTG